MRLSPQRHTLAVLRILINLTQKELAELAHCSRPTIQAVELGKLKLSFDLAQRIHLATGVSSEWLMADDVSQPPMATDGKPYTKAFFEQMRAELLSPKKPGIREIAALWQAREMFRKHVRILAVLYSEGYKRGKVPVVFYKSVMSSKEIFEKEIGEDAEIAERLRPMTHSECGPVDLYDLTNTLREFEDVTNQELLRRLRKSKEPLPKYLHKLVPGWTKPTPRPRKKK